MVAKPLAEKRIQYKLKACNVCPPGSPFDGTDSFLGKVNVSVLGVAPEFAFVSSVTHLLGSLNIKWWEVVGSELVTRRKR